MSTNPFRRSSLKEPSNSNNSDVSTVRRADRSNHQDGPATSLSVNTKNPSNQQKHVNFASPPAVPISPASYPPSPESFRISPAFPNVQPILPTPTDYSQAIQSDPFAAEAETDEDDGAIEQALQNARNNVEIASQGPPETKEDAVRNTLSKFASAPRRQPTARSAGTTGPNTSRQTMDVDAFKRLLLTGNSDQPNLEPSKSDKTPKIVNTHTQVEQPSRSATGSSVFQTAGLAETNTTHYQISVDQAADNRKPPPPPKSKHGRAIKEKPLPQTPPTAAQVVAENIPSEASIELDSIDSSTSSTPKRAPPPPLSRRRSNNSGLTRSNSSRHSSISDQDSAAGSTENIHKVPPLPPARRNNSKLERRPSSDLPPTVEETELVEPSGPADSTTVEFRPTQSSLRRIGTPKRTSLINTSAPPLPPPRRGRDSSRSSLDSQRPAMAALLENHESARSSGEYSRRELDGESESAASNANNILADLAALQQEVDAARRHVN